MKSWLNIPMRDGYVYTLPVADIVNHCAQVFWATKNTGNSKFPDVRIAVLRTFEEDPTAIGDWVTLHMPWDEAEKYARLRTLGNPPQTFEAADYQDALLGLNGPLKLDDEAPRTFVDALPAVPYPPLDFRRLMLEMGLWSYATFGGDSRTGALIEAARKELTEIENRPFDLTGWVGLMFLAYDGARRHAGGPEALNEACIVIEQAMIGKFEVLRTRSWPPPDPEGLVPTEHIREPVALATLAASAAWEDKAEDIVIKRPAAASAGAASPPVTITTQGDKNAETLESRPTDGHSHRPE